MMKAPMWGIFLCLIFLLVSPCLSELCNQNDKKVLLQIKKSLNNASLLSSWDPKTEPCTNWTGIECSSVTTAKNIRVIGIRFSGIDVDPIPTAILPPEIGNLSFLQSLDIEYLRNLTGTIPSTFAKLKHLEYLRITGTDISGPIPEFIGEFKQLTTLDLSMNKLTGHIPGSIASIPNIDMIRLGNNRLTGSIPDSFGSFKHTVSELSLYLNQLSGKIPKSLSKSSFIDVLLYQNKLRGDLSMFLGLNNTTNYLDVSSNELEFDFSKTKFPESLEYLHIHNNKIFGRIPESLATLPNLNGFSFGYNLLCGKIPLGGILQSSGARQFDHNLCLCGAPLDRDC